MFRTSRIVLAVICLTALQSSAVAVAETFRCTVAPHEPFLDQANRFVLAGLRYQPVEATQAGYHGDGNVLDSELDDSSPATIIAERALYLSGKLCFAGAKVSTVEETADLALLRNNIESALFELNALQSYRYRPQDYVEMIGSGLFFPLPRPMAPSRHGLPPYSRGWRKSPGFLRKPGRTSKRPTRCLSIRPWMKTRGTLASSSKSGE